MSDVPPLPNMLEILLAESEHYQELVLSQCSVVDLLRLGTATRSVRKVCLREARRRRPDVIIRATYWDKVDAPRGIHYYPDVTQYKETAIVLKDGQRDPVAIKSILEDCDIQDCHRRFASVLHSLLVHCRIRVLSIEDDVPGPRLFFRIFHGLPMLDKGDDACFVDTLVMPLDIRVLPFLKTVTSRRLCLEYRRCGFEEFGHWDGTYEDVFGCSEDFIAHRGMREAEVIEFDGRSEGREASPMLRILPLLKAPIINSREHAKLESNVMFDYIREWQRGYRKIDAFVGCVGIGEKEYAKSFEHFCEKFSTKMHCDAIAAPLDDVIPIYIRRQMQKNEEFHGSLEKPVIYFEVYHFNETKSLIVVVKALEEKAGAITIGIFPKP